MIVGYDLKSISGHIAINFFVFVFTSSCVNEYAKSSCMLNYICIVFQKSNDFLDDNKIGFFRFIYLSHFKARGGLGSFLHFWLI